MPAHVDHQHVLGLEGLLFPRAVLPAAHKLFLFPVDMVVVDVLRKQKRKMTNSRKYFLDFPPFFILFSKCLQNSVILTSPSHYQLHSLEVSTNAPRKKAGEQEKRGRGGERRGDGRQDCEMEPKQDFQIKPCHSPSYCPVAARDKPLTVVLPWQHSI